MRNLLVLANPTAGGGRAAAVLPTYEALLRAAGHDVEIVRTRDIEHADELGAQAAADGRVACAVGGDGMVGRVAGAVARGGGLFAVLPGGRGNDFANAVGIPTDPEGAAAVLADGEERRLDLGTVDGRPFVCIASVGFDSAVQERVMRTKLRIGALVYPAAAVATVAGWRHATFEIDVDGRKRSLRGWSVVTANTRSYGGGMRVAPDAVPDDGLLDVVTLAELSKWRFLRTFPKVFRGTHVAEPEVDICRARTIRVSADRAFRVFADGDPIGALPCEIGVLPGALRILLPRTGGPSGG